METTSKDIDTLLLEERRVAPPARVRTPAVARFRSPGECEAQNLQRGLGSVLGAGGARTRLVVRAVRNPARVEPPVREVVPRRQAEPRLQLRRPPRGERTRRQGRLLLGGR